MRHCRCELRGDDSVPYQTIRTTGAASPGSRARVRAAGPRAVVAGRENERSHHGLRGPPGAGCRAGVRTEQGGDRARGDVPLPQALGLAARSLGVQHPSCTLNCPSRCRTSAKAAAPRHEPGRAVVAPFLALQHPPRPLNWGRAVWHRPRTNRPVKGWSRVKTDTARAG
jgi:hypothetical protein